MIRAILGAQLVWLRNVRTRSRRTGTVLCVLCGETETVENILARLAGAERAFERLEWL